MAVLPSVSIDLLPEKLEEWSKTDMYGDLGLGFRPWIKPEDLKFYNDFQLLFNVLFNSYDAISKDIEAIYESDPRIRRLIGDLGSIPRATKPQYKNRLNERLDESLMARFRDRIFI